MRSLSQKKREVILRAAAVVFARKGYHRALVDEVARQAGVGKGTVYRYFEDKEDLFFSIIDQGVVRLIGSMESASRSNRDPVGSLRGILEAMADFTRDSKPIFDLLHQVEARDRKKQFERINRYNRRILAITEGVLRKGMKQGAFRKGNARLWALAAASSARTAYFMSPRGDRGRTTGILMDLLLRGMAPGRETNGGR